MNDGLKHVLERKGWIKEEPATAGNTEYKVYTKCILPLDLQDIQGFADLSIKDKKRSIW